MATDVPHDLIHPASADVAELERLRELLATLTAEESAADLSDRRGRAVELPASVLSGLRLVVEAMLRGEALTVLPRGRNLTTQEAAALLGVSRPHVIKLLDAGDIAYHRVGSHRRVRVGDVLGYRERRDAERRARLSELTRLSEEVEGGYR